MVEKKDRVYFKEKKASRTYLMLSAALGLLVLITAGLHFAIISDEKKLTQMVDDAQSQSMLMQRLALLISEYQSNNDGVLLEDMRNMASAALVNHQTLQNAFTSALPPVMNDGSPLMNSMATLGEYVSNCMIYASAPLTQGARENGQRLIMQSRNDAGLWDSLTTDYIAAMQGKIDLLADISLVAYLAMLGLLGYQFLKIFTPAMAYVTQQRADLERVSATDFLSGTYNRATLFKIARMLIGTYKRQQQPLSALAIDLDNLKMINDDHGRAAGDALIRKAGQTLTEALRTSDVIGRIGGGEFGVFLPSIDEFRAAAVAEKLRAAIEGMAFILNDVTVPVCVSIGVAQLKEEHGSPDDLLLIAEEALRRAKDGGRNLVFSYGTIEAEAKAAQKEADGEGK